MKNSYRKRKSTHRKRKTTHRKRKTNDSKLISKKSNKKKPKITMKGGGPFEALKANYEFFEEQVETHLDARKKKPSFFKSVFGSRKKKQTKETTLTRLENKVNAAFEKYMNKDGLKIPKAEIDDINNDYQKLNGENGIIQELNNTLDRIVNILEIIDNKKYEEIKNMYSKGNIIQSFELEGRMKDLDYKIVKLNEISADSNEMSF